MPRGAQTEDFDVRNCHYICFEIFRVFQTFIRVWRLRTLFVEFRSNSEDEQGLTIVVDVNVINLDV